MLNLGNDFMTAHGWQAWNSQWQCRLGNPCISDTSFPIIIKHFQDQPVTITGIFNLTMMHVYFMECTVNTCVYSLCKVVSIVNGKQNGNKFFIIRLIKLTFLVMYMY